MSQFLAPYYQSVPLGYSILQTQTIDALLVGYGWQNIFKTIEPMGYVGTLSGHWVAPKIAEPQESVPHGSGRVIWSVSSGPSVSQP